MFKKIYIKLFVRSFQQKNRYLKKRGVQIGNNTRIMSSVDDFGTEPYLIRIGDNCLISRDVLFLTHDGGIVVLNNLKFFSQKMDKLAFIKVGNNCFIGARSIILPGVTIGDNCIIGAGSIVTKNVENNSIVCGVPARRIKSIDEYADGVKKSLYPTSGMDAKQKKDYCLEHHLFD